MGKYYDVPSVMQVIGGVYLKPALIDMTEKYTFNEDDFSGEEFHRILFGAIYNLHQLGADAITPSTIENYLEQRPKKLAIYQANKGNEYIQKLAENTQISAFDYYYQRVKKMTLLRMYDSIGMNVSWLYDTDNILDVKKKQAQEEWLDNHSADELASEIDEKIQGIRLKYVDNKGDGDFIQAGKGINELLERLEKNPEFGYPLFDPYLNTITRGARLKKFYLRSASTGLGKAIPNYTVIPTPSGYRKVEDIKVGDYLFGQDGKPTKVLAVYPQPEDKEIWKVTFANGCVAECCGEHLWEYNYYSKGEKVYKVESTQTIYERAIKLKNGFKSFDGKGYHFYIRLNEPVEYPEKKYSLHPYIMGAFLGDGSLNYNKQDESLSFSSDEDFLKDYAELWNAKPENKFIPAEYLLGSVEQRFALLQGLMDTNGVGFEGKTDFTTVSPQFRDDFMELCRSLGFAVKYSTDKKTDEYTTSECYIVHIQNKEKLKSILLHPKEKKKVTEGYAATDKSTISINDTAIVSIERTNKKVPMTCFTVDNESHLFLMNDFIVTHNTRTMISDICSIGCDEIYDESEGKYVDNGTAESALFITTEQEEDEIQTMMLAFISAVEEEHIITGTYEPGERERVFKAAEILGRSNIHIKKLPDFSLQDIENCIKYGIREWDARYIGYDYIHSSMKILSEIGSRAGVKGLREDNVLFLLSVKLKDICNQYGVFILSSTQLNGNYVDAEVFDQNLLRGAKAIADKIDVGLLMLPVNDVDRAALKNICAKLGVSMPDIKISVYKNRRGKYNNVLMWAKARKGICRIETMFVTNYQYELINMEKTKIKVKPRIAASDF